jgi:hypothetical protein
VTGELRVTLSWPRAVAITGALVALGVALLIVVPNLIVTQLGGLDRGQRSGLATIWFFAMLAVVAWLLRRLQARYVI